MRGEASLTITIGKKDIISLIHEQLMASSYCRVKQGGCQYREETYAGLLGPRLSIARRNHVVRSTNGSYSVSVTRLKLAASFAIPLLRPVQGLPEEKPIGFVLPLPRHGGVLIYWQCREIKAGIEPHGIMLRGHPMKKIT